MKPEQMRHRFEFCNSSRGLCECGRLKDDPMHKVDCSHNVIRKSRDRHAENVYVCGNCGDLFAVNPHREPKPSKEPMFDRRPPWGLRDRQA